MVGKCIQVYVLTAVAQDMTHGLFVSANTMTGFSGEYLPLVSYYSRVQKCTIGVTGENFQLV